MAASRPRSQRSVGTLTLPRVSKAAGQWRCMTHHLKRVIGRRQRIAFPRSRFQMIEEHAHLDVGTADLGAIFRMKRDTDNSHSHLIATVIEADHLVGPEKSRLNRLKTNAAAAVANVPNRRALNAQ